MPSGEMLIKLFENFKNQDEEGFAKIAFEIIKEEQKKNHFLLADKLKRAMFSPSSDIKRTPRYINSIGNLPKDKDNNTNLVEIKYTDKEESDIILHQKIREKINNVVMENKKRDVLSTYGLKPKRKLLFCGPPGCGKTLSVEVLSNLLSIPILYTRFDSVVSSYLGETASNLSKIFDFAESGNWILFFDEFDAIGKSRDNNEEHGELKRVVNTFLQLMDNFESETIIIAATNYEKLIDNALWRRFDEVIYFGKPTEKEIEKMLEIKFRVFKYHFKFDDLLKDMVGLSFSDIERICQDSIKQAILQDENSVKLDKFKEVLDKEKERQKLISSFSE
ncbi:SpoVK/Ycf46/Vps4 family AAA+-type ATPase [Desulfitispora alkaliphila]|uniref:AAA family ATPase n=1 Tax=Desulfitispora alkaliphila TaxID=622674 RepID=UPI003D1FC155